MYCSYMSNLNFNFCPENRLLNDSGAAIFPGACVGFFLGFPPVFVILSRVSEPLSPQPLTAQTAQTLLDLVVDGQARSVLVSSLNPN